MDFKDKIAPFFFLKDDSETASLCLYVEDYIDKDEMLFRTRENEGFEGNGYDWCSIAIVLIEEKNPELKKAIRFNPEADMFCAFSSDIEALKKFGLAFKEVCENDEALLDLFSRANIDWFENRFDWYEN